MAKIPFEVPVLSITAIDGDTFSLLLDLGFGVRYAVHGRLEGVDTPEKSTDAGKLVKQISETWAKSGVSLRWRSTQLDKFGRSLGHLLYANSRERLSDYLILKGLARQYGGEKRQEWTAEELGIVEQHAKELKAKCVNDAAEGVFRYKITGKGIKPRPVDCD